MLSHVKIFEAAEAVEVKTELIHLIKYQLSKKKKCNKK